MWTWWNILCCVRLVPKIMCCLVAKFSIVSLQIIHKNVVPLGLSLFLCLLAERRRPKRNIPLENWFGTDLAKSMTNWAKYNHLRVTVCFAALVVWSSGLEPASESSANKWPWFDTCWSLWARACSDVHVQQTLIKNSLVCLFKIFRS